METPRQEEPNEDKRERANIAFSSLHHFLKEVEEDEKVDLDKAWYDVEHPLTGIRYSMSQGKNLANLVEQCKEYLEDLTPIQQQSGLGLLMRAEIYLKDQGAKPKKEKGDNPAERE